MSGESRHVWRIVFRNFINSLRPRQITGNSMGKRFFTIKFSHRLHSNILGKDYLGNAYFEIPADPQRGKRKPTRWYDPPKGQDFQDPIPAEWESWLRYRRSEPPTEEEIAKNVAIAELKKINASKIEEKRLAEGGSLPTPVERGAQSFPTYPEYHTGHPEIHPKNKGD